MLLTQYASRRQTIETLDLLDFFKVLVKGIWMIALLTAIFAGIGYGISYLMPQQWRSEAQFSQPTSIEIGNYYSVYAMYQFIHDDKPVSADINSKVDNKKVALDIQQSVADFVYDEFKRQLAAYDTKASFWQATSYYKQRITGDSKIDGELLQRLVNQIQFVASNEYKNINDSVKLDIDNPKQATDLLLQYVNYVNSKTKKILFDDLINKWSTLSYQVKSAVEMKQARSQLAGLDWESKYNMMRSVALSFDDKFASFRFLKTPTVADKFSPNPWLWTFMLGFLGFLIGCTVVVLSHLRKVKEEMDLL